MKIEAIFPERAFRRLDEVVVGVRTCPRKFRDDPVIIRILIAAVMLAAAPFLLAAPPFTGPKQTGLLASPDLKEASGLAASRLGPDRTDCGR